MITGVLNTLVMADTSSFDKGMQKASKGAAKLKSDVDKSGVGISASISSFGNVSGLDTAFGGILGRVANLGSQFRSMFSGITSSIGDSFRLSFGKIQANATSSMSSIASVFRVGIPAAMGATVAAIAAAAAATAGLTLALHSLASQGAANILETRALAREMGVSMEFASTLGANAEIDQRRFATAMTHMQRSIVNMSGEAMRGFAAIRVSPEILRHMPHEQQLRAVLDGFRNLENPTMRAAAAMNIFGESGVRMLDFIGEGQEGLERMRAAAQRFGTITTEDEANSIRNANREWFNMSLAIEGIRENAAVMFAPVWESIGRLGGVVGEFVVSTFNEARPYIAAFGSDFMQAFGPIWEWIKTIGGGLGEIFRESMPLIREFGSLIMETFRTGIGMGLGGLFEAMTRGGNFMAPIVAGVRAVIPWLVMAADVTKAFVRFVGDVARAIWSGIWAAVRAVGNLIASVFNSSGISDWLSSISGGWNNFRDFAITSLAFAKVGLEQIGVVWRIVWAGVQIGWLNIQRTALVVMQAIAGFINTFVVQPFLAGIGQIIDAMGGLSQFDPTGNLGEAVETARAVVAGIRGGVNAGVDNMLNGIDQQIAGLQRGLNVVAGDFGRAVGNQVAEWMALFGRGAAAAANGMNNALGNLPIVVGQLRAITGVEATLRGSERSFSLLYGTRGNQDYYQRAQLDRLNDVRQLLRDVRGDFRQAPALRRARL